MLIRRAEDAEPVAPVVLAHFPEGPAAGIAYSTRHRELFVATSAAVYAAPYAPGGNALSACPVAIAHVRTGPVAPNSDGDVHVSTSVAFDDAKDRLYVSVGSSCNACSEADDTRASIFAMRPDGSGMHKIAKRIRNAIALTVDPQTGALWAGDAGQDSLPLGHPFEFADDVTAHTGVADYGWPDCEENRHDYAPGARCSATVAPVLEFPAYSTLIGAVFYPRTPVGRYAFPQKYRGGLFIAAHGSWHRTLLGTFAAEPMVAYVPMRDDLPATPVDWNDPHKQWETFLGGFQSGYQRAGRPTGIAVATSGSLFVADDAAGAIYRIRPKGTQ
jgi:glucose/arabinose dehydrogenase